MDAQRSNERTGRLAPLAQAGLAALVAGSLLTFSTIAFRTAFDGSSDTRAVTVSAPRTAAAEPVVLPTPPRNDSRPRETVPAAAADNAESAQVLGIQIKRRTPDARRKEVSRPARSVKRRPSTVADDAHRPSRGKGHEKARGKGHHKDHDHDHDAKAKGRAKGKKKH